MPKNNLKVCHISWLISILVEEYTTDVCSLMRHLYAGGKQPLSIPTEVKTEIDEVTYSYDTICVFVQHR